MNLESKFMNQDHNHLIFIDLQFSFIQSIKNIQL